MEELFADRLIDQMRAKKSIICVGLDPRIGEKSTIPTHLLEQSNSDNNKAIWAFNKEIVDGTIAVTPIYKPQIAFYEKYGAMDALRKTIEFVHQKGALVLLDAKRNDIGSTAQAYAHAVFEGLQADAVTVNGYLGVDGIRPFLDYAPQGKGGKGVIVLLKTSNPSSGDFQDLFSIALPDQSPEVIEIAQDHVQLTRNYIHMTRLMRKWGEDPKLVGEPAIRGNHGYAAIGGVVGATYPAQMQIIRQEAPKNFILIPGYGAQGGTAADIVQGVNADGLGAIVSASRSINFAYQNAPYKDLYSETEFGKAAGHAARDMQTAINQALQEAGKSLF
ncbi:MAG: orotidine-5'-phosphate decarboxylase [Promethearchaeota archaeon]